MIQFNIDQCPVNNQCSHRELVRLSYEVLRLLKAPCHETLETTFGNSEESDWTY